MRVLLALIAVLLLPGALAKRTQREWDTFVSSDQVGAAPKL